MRNFRSYNTNMTWSYTKHSSIYPSCPRDVRHSKTNYRLWGHPSIENQGQLKRTCGLGNIDGSSATSRIQHTRTYLDIHTALWPPLPVQDTVKRKYFNHEVF